MYPQSPREMVADPSGSAEHTLGTATIDFKSLHYVTCCFKSRVALRSAQFKEAVNVIWLQLTL